MRNICFVSMWGSHGALRRSTEQLEGAQRKAPIAASATSKNLGLRARTSTDFLYCSLIRKDIGSQNGRMGSLLTNTAGLTDIEYRQVQATKQKKTSKKDVRGWNVGLEPTTLGTTIRCSAN